MTFRDTEKQRYKTLKSTGTDLFTSDAKQDGVYWGAGLARGNRYYFCLADGYAEENLFKDIRKPAIEYFKNRNILWHDGVRGRQIPSNHLCCSQSCCVNFLYPMVDNPLLLKMVFQRLYHEMKEVLPIEQDRQPQDKSSPYMVFEWIGTKDYLNEQKRKKVERTRGANYTSADFAFRFRRNDGKIHLVLGEWKYTEYYGSEDKGVNNVRKQNYREAFFRNDRIFDDRNEALYSALFFEPFYQLMRLQLMGQEMERFGELDANEVSILHICPRANKEFRDKVTSPYLTKIFPDKGTTEIWERLVSPGKFLSKSVEEVLSIIIENGSEANPGWVDYLQERYRWENSKLSV